jgi:CheY-like chemotaxis protein
MAHLVIAEDAPHMLRLLEMTLRKKGHEWTAAVNGNAALEAIRSRKPDLAILDIMLPGLDGLQILQALKTDPETAAIPVIMLTAEGHAVTRQQAEEGGAAAFINKPFSPTGLLEVIDRLTSPGE